MVWRKIRRKIFDVLQYLKHPCHLKWPKDIISGKYVESRSLFFSQTFNFHGNMIFATQLFHIILIILHHVQAGLISGIKCHLEHQVHPSAKPHFIFQTFHFQLCITHVVDPNLTLLGN